MILSELRNYMQARRRVSLVDMVNRFNVDPEALRGMLDRLVSKGRIEKIQQNNSCAKTCSKCDVNSLEIYQWKEE